MKKKKLFLSIISSIVLLVVFSSMSYAEPNQNGFYLGAECGEASLNNDLYIYSDQANARQPELNISESNKWKGPAYSLYAGYHFISQEIDLFGQKPTLQLGAQGGYANLGKYTIDVRWNNNQTVTGYRKVEEQSIDLLLSSSLLWENGLNLSGKVGVARLGGHYEEKNLPDVRQPELPYNGKTDFTVYRPEIAIGVGYLINKQINVYLQYNTILGDTPEFSDERFSDSESINMPNTVYKVDRLTLGATYTF
jgi:hypothetical protein